MKKQYEMIWEILNSCERNQMRDVLFEEVETEDPEAYVRARCHGSNISLETERLRDGSVIIHLDADGLIQKISFTEL